MDNATTKLLRQLLAESAPEDLFSDQLEQAAAPHIDREDLQQRGQVFTPWPVADFMTRWVMAAHPNDVLDPAAGLQIFGRAAFNVNPNVQVNSFDIDSNMRQWTKKLQQMHPEWSLAMDSGDWLQTPWQQDTDGLLLNPPYIRHHQISNKLDLQAAAFAASDVQLSATSNLYCWFVWKALFHLRPGGRAAIIVPSEFLNANYGRGLKRALLESGAWRWLLAFPPGDQGLFDGVLTTSCILLLEKPVTVDDILPLRLGEIQGGVDSLDHLSTHADQENEWRKQPGVSVQQLNEYNPDSKWSALFSKALPAYHPLVPWTTYAKTTRGIATGANHFFVLTPSQYQSLGIAEDAVVPCLTKAQQIPANQHIFRVADYQHLVNNDAPVLLLSTQDLLGSDLEQAALQAYIDTGEEMGVDQGYLCSHRFPWWSMEQRNIPDWLIKVFYRGNVQLLENEAGVRTLAAFHNIYLTELGKEYRQLFGAYLLTDIAQELLAQQRRQYGQGLDKVEPNDVNLSLMPDLQDMPLPLQRQITKHYRQWRLLMAKNNTDKASQHQRKISELFRSWLTS